MNIFEYCNSPGRGKDEGPTRLPQMVPSSALLRPILPFEGSRRLRFSSGSSTLARIYLSMAMMTTRRHLIELR
jgi:hypothetical protein